MHRATAAVVCATAALLWLAPGGAGAAVVPLNGLYEGTDSAGERVAFSVAPIESVPQGALLIPTVVGAKRSRLARGKISAPVPTARAVRATSPIVALITVPAPIVQEGLQKVESS